MVEYRDDLDGGALGISRFEGPIDRLVQAGHVGGDINVYAAPPQNAEPAPHQIGPPVRPYTNNKSQLASLTARIKPAERDGDARVAIVCGPPGSGRSALVTEVANARADDFPDGIFYTSLGSRDGELLRARLSEMLVAAGYPAEKIPDSLDGRAGMWRTWSKGKQLLLVVDDAITASQVDALRPGPGRSSVAVIRSGTARLSAKEAEVHMEPMSDASARVLLSELAPGVDLDADPDAVAELLRQCDGWTIALKVVGVMLEDTSPTKLARKLSRSGRALRTLSPHDGVALRPVLNAAYERLGGNDLAQTCYRLLGVHPHGAGVAAETVVALLAEDPDDIDSALSELVRLGLAVEIVPGRWQLASPALVGPHAVELLTESGEHDQVRRGILAHYLSRTLACSRGWLPDRIWWRELWSDLPAPDPDQEAAKDWLRTERTNVRAVIDVADDLGDLDAVCRLAVALWPLHNEEKHTNEMIAVCSLAAEAADTLAAPLVASVVRMQLGLGLRDRRDFGEAIQVLETAMENARTAESDLARYSALEASGLVHREQGEVEQASLLLRENLEFARSSGDPRRTALASFHLATVARDPEEVMSLLDEAAAVLGREPYNRAKIVLGRGRRLLDFGSLADAAKALEEAAALADADEWHHERIQARTALADLARAHHDVETERRILTRALEIACVQGLGADQDEIIDRLEQLPPLSQ